ncbi:MAG: NADH-quinone oxidoreductase subunit J family protein, partial [Acidimicrobiia bacterium]
IMLTRAPLKNDPGLDNDQRAGALIVSAGLLALLVSLLVRTFGSRPVGLEEQVAKAGDVADSIFLTYVIPFEVVSVLLLAALIGSIVIARKD